MWCPAFGMAPWDAGGMHGDSCRNASHEVEAPFLSPLCRHPVWPDGGSVFAELSMYELAMSLYAPLCRQLLFFDPAVH